MQRVIVSIAAAPESHVSRSRRSVYDRTGRDPSASRRHRDVRTGTGDALHDGGQAPGASGNANRSRRRLRRGWLRMGVREFLVLVAVSAGVCGFFAHRARVERSAAAAIFRSGGSFSRDYDSSARPGRLTRLAGNGHFEHIVSIAGGPRFTNDVYSGVGSLRKLETLITYPGTVTDVGMAHLGRLRGLRKLQVTTRRASAASVANLAGMTRLGTLRLYGIPVADDDLAVLAGMAELRELQLDSPRITDNGLAQHIARRSSLETLGLHSRLITDAGLAPLRGLTRLRVLDLSGTLVTDAGLTHLIGLRDLDTLTLRKTRVTAAGLEDLLKARPGIRVIW